MNTFKKFCPNVFVAKCPEQHQKGDVITLTTRYGKEVEVTIWNLVGKTRSDDHFLYSFTREDGMNPQEYARKRAERINGWASANERKSNQKWEESNEGADFLRLGEPIKIGHHSEKRHRALIARNHARMDKAVELSRKAEGQRAKAEYWESRTNIINLAMPESVEYFEFQLEKATEHHRKMKAGEIERSHSYSLTYAKKANQL